MSSVFILTPELIMKRRILTSLIAIAILIPLGLLSRHINWLTEEVGDALWAMMVFCIWHIILVRRNLNTIAIVSLIHSYLTEFSQLITWQWLTTFRTTFIGHMMFGQGFLWIDLVALTIGIVCIYLVYKAIEPSGGE